MQSPKRTWIYLIFTVSVIFAFLILTECTHPYYFMCDDNMISYFTQYNYTVDSLKDLEIPFLNFHRFMGIEFLSHGQTGMFDPVMYISYAISNLLFGHTFALIDIMAVIHLIIAGTGMFLVIRKLSGNPAAASLGAVAWSLNSFVFFLGRSWFVVILTASIFPYILLSSLYLLSNRNIKALLVSSIAKTGCYLLVHHPQFFFYSIAADFVFIISYSIIVKKRETIGFIWRYFASVFLSIISSMPLWLPTFLSITSSSNRQSSFVSEDLLTDKQDVVSLMLGIFSPFLDERDAILSSDIQARLGHIGYLFVFVIIIYLASIKKNIKNDKIAFHAVISSVISMFFIFLYSGFPPFIKLQAHLPVVSNFRYLFKAMMFFHFYHIVAGSMCLTALMKNFRKNSKALTAGLMTVQLLNFGLIYFLYGPVQWGINIAAKIPFEDEAVDIIGTERYVSVGFPISTLDEESKAELPYDYTRSLSYNLSTYYKLDNYIGYDSIYPVEFDHHDDEYLAATHFGAVFYLTDKNIKSLRSNGVRWYIVDDADTDFRYITLAYLEKCGISKRFTSNNRLFYYDESAPSPVSCAGKALDFKLTHNSINIQTAKDFEGGNVSILYYFSDKYKVTIDGTPAVVSPSSENFGMTLYVPAGEHNVKLEYIDNVFIYSSAGVIGVYVLIAAGMLITGKKARRKSFK